MQEYPDSDQPHEGLDGLFRKSAEEFEPPFDPAAWQDMRARLEEHDRQVLMNKWLLRSSVLLAVLLLGFIGWYSWEVANAGGASVRRQPGPPARAQAQPAVSESVQALPESRPAVTDPACKPVTKVIVQPTATGPRAVRVGRQPAPAKTEPLTTSGVAASGVARPEKSVLNSNNQSVSLLTKPSDRPANRTGKREAPAGLTVNSQGRKGHMRQMADVPANRQPVAGSGGLTETDKTAPAAMPPQRSARTIANPDYFDPASEGLVRSSDPDSVAQADAIPVWQDVARLQSHSFVWPVFASVSVDPLPVKPADRPAAAGRVRVHGLSVRAVLSPDLTTIGLHDFTRPGVNMGLLAEYRLSNRWSVQAGAMWSKKVYEAYPEQYEWPSNWKWQVPVLGVDGVCSMVDIPLNVRYDVVLQPRQSGLTPSRWFVNTGVTSFVMLREVYNYQYENPDDPRIKFRQWAGKTGPYGLSHLNISVGYERSLTKRWAWQIEPFIKAPLQGVGRFKINLISTGTFLSVRYKL